MLIPIGNNLFGEKEYLSGVDLKAHAHGIGASRKGKSKLIEQIVREFIKQRIGFCVIDPNGHLFEDLLSWLAFIKPNRQKLNFFNPSYQKKVVGFNPFRLEGEKTEATINARVDVILSATMKALLKNDDLSEMPRLERIARCLFYLIIEQDLSLEVIRYFFTPSLFALRDEIIARCQSDAIREQFSLLIDGKKTEAYLEKLESTINRLYKFTTDTTVRRVVGLQRNTLDLRAIINEKQALFVNLQQSQTFSETSSRIIGTLLVNEIWGIIRQRSRHDAQRLPKFYLIIDEFQNFITPDIQAMLDQSAKYGLHLLLFHQHLGQLSHDLKNSLTACHTRFVFGGITDQDARAMFAGSYYEAEDLQKAPLLPPQHFFLKRPEQKIMEVVAPFIKEATLPSEKIEKYLAEQTAEYLTPHEVDQMLELPTKNLCSSLGINRSGSVVQDDKLDKDEVEKRANRAVSDAPHIPVDDELYF
jgi:hypothetical protein